MKRKHLFIRLKRDAILADVPVAVGTLLGQVELLDGTPLVEVAEHVAAGDTETRRHEEHEGQE
jgi:hypothetical protein